MVGSLDWALVGSVRVLFWDLHWIHFLCQPILIRVCRNASCVPEMAPPPLVGCCQLQLTFCCFRFGFHIFVPLVNRLDGSCFFVFLSVLAIHSHPQQHLPTALRSMPRPNDARAKWLKHCSFPFSFFPVANRSGTDPPPQGREPALWCG